MVVVDNAKKVINKTVDITVTSVHQTTAGKMIFGRLDERSEHAPRSAAVAPENPVASAASASAAAASASSGGRPGFVTESPRAESSPRSATDVSAERTARPLMPGPTRD
jgi:hypothetical protein